MSSDFVWYEFHTADGAAAEAFYRGVLGWGAQDSGMPDRPYTLVTAGGVPVGGILQKPAGSFTAGAHPGWMGYIGVDDAAVYAKRIAEAGGVVHRAVETIPGVGSFAVVADPQGAIFVVFQPPNAGRQRETPPPGTPGTGVWHDLFAADWPSAFEFYSGLFGWTKSRALNMGSDGMYQIFESNGRPLGGMMNRMDEALIPGWIFYFLVDEIEAAAARAKQHGGRIVHGPAEVPGDQMIAHCIDPEGAIFAMVAPKKPEAK